MSNQQENSEEMFEMGEELDHHLTMGEAFNRLKNNDDFKKVIMDGYLTNKVLSSVSLLGVPAISEQGRRAGVMEDLVSASNLQYYFSMIEQFYEGAKNPVLSDEEEAERERLGTGH